MRKAILSIIVVAILIAVSVVSINWLYRTGDFASGPEPTTVSELVDCSNEFSFDMYKQLASEGDENIFFSPYSITTALGMAYEGARGQTAKEMTRVLNFPADNETRWNMMESYQEYFNTLSDSYNLSTANAYWLMENGQLLDAYRIAIESYYLAHGEELDFAGDPVGSAATINTWVEEQTNGRIKNILDPELLRDAYLVLTNAIYFKSDWEYKFNPNATHLHPFYLDGGEEIETGLMHMNNRSINFNYTSNDDDQLLQLPYKNKEISMYILLPNKNDISSLESRLDHSYLNTLKGNMTPQNVDIYMPRFKFEQKYELKEMLKDMGMPSAFSGSADFSGIADARLYISDVIHQSFVEVNEEGTEAAAATVVVVRPTSAQPFVPVFNANHPFIFFIVHEGTGQLLFMGKVGNPGA